MQKRDIVRDLERKFPGCGLLTTAQVAQYKGVSRWAVNDLLQGLEHVGSEHKRRYFVGDVAERILSLRQM